jgi:hypothetical protein
LASTNPTWLAWNQNKITWFSLTSSLKMLNMCHWNLVLALHTCLKFLKQINFGSHRYNITPTFDKAQKKNSSIIFRTSILCDSQINIYLRMTKHKPWWDL